MFDSLLGTAFHVAIAVVIVVLVVEFVAGCGETTYHADRTWETNECVFLDVVTVKGRW